MINIIINIAAIVLYLLIAYFVINAIRTHNLMRKHTESLERQVQKEIILLDLRIDEELDKDFNSEDRSEKTVQ